MNYSKRKKGQPRQPKLKQDWGKKDSNKPEKIPHKVLKDFVGDVNPPKEFGHKIRVQSIDSNKVGTYAIDGKSLPIFRIDVWVDWWTDEMQQYPSSRIGPSYYQAYDKDKVKFYDLNKSTPNCFENFSSESKRKK